MSEQAGPAMRRASFPAELARSAAGMARDEWKSILDRYADNANDEIDQYRRRINKLSVALTETEQALDAMSKLKDGDPGLVIADIDARNRDNERVMLDGTVIGGTPTAENVVRRTALRQNVPNPFNPSTTVFYDMAQAGPVQVELIQPTTEKPSAYRDSVEPGSVGFHHVCVWTHDIDADTEYFDQLGYPTVTMGDAGHVRFAYYDTRPLMGCMLEVVEHRAAIAEHFQLIADAGAQWDGTRPIRSRSEL